MPTKLTCPNCKTALSCGCKKARAIDGSRCCKSCVGSVNSQIIKKRNK